MRPRPRPGALGTEYTVTPMDVCDGLDMPSFSAVEQLGAACPGGAALDRLVAGCVINDWDVKFTSGPGRNNSMLGINFVGSGKVVEPSAIVLPDAPLVEHPLPGGSATVTINGVDYVANKSLLSLEAGFANNTRLDTGYFIGSGVDANGYALRGRMERGDRAYSFSFVARLESGSTELAKLKAHTTGTASVVLKGDLIEVGHYNQLDLTYHKIVYEAVELSDDAGIVVVQVRVTPLYDGTLGVLTCKVKTPNALVGGLA